MGMDIGMKILGVSLTIHNHIITIIIQTILIKMVGLTVMGIMGFLFISIVNKKCIEDVIE